MRTGPCRPPRGCPFVVRAALVLLLAVLSPSCTLEPAGTQREMDRLSAEAGPFAVPRHQRSLPPLPDDPALDDLLAAALLRNGELEAAWHDWRAALQDVLVASGWPNTDLALGLTHLLTSGSAWETSTVMLGFDPMDMLLLPYKVRQRGRVAFERALAAGCAFEQRRLVLRAEVLSAAADWALLGVRLTLAEEDLALLQALERSSRAGLLAGSSQDAWIAARIERARAEVVLADLAAQEPGRRAALNALVGRRHDAPLPLPHIQPPSRSLPDDEAWELASGVILNPRLQGRLHEALALAEQHELAHLRIWPNIAPNAQASGGGPEALGVMITLPVNVPAVRAAVRRAEAERDAAAARLGQERLDEQALFAATLAALRGDERTLAILRDDILPAVDALLSLRVSAYAHGTLPFAGLVEARRMRIEVRAALSETVAAHERRLADLERIGGLDLARLSSSADSQHHIHRSPEDPS